MRVIQTDLQCLLQNGAPGKEFLSIVDLVVLSVFWFSAAPKLLTDMSLDASLTLPDFNASLYGGSKKGHA